nr:SDR family oxidoreductase [Lachnospiraceae bacterium]
GFLGIHILLELLKHPEYYDRIYCLVRPTKRQTGERRLRARLMFFDEAEAVEEIGKTVFALQGDISAEEIFEQKPDVKIDTVINCAADVSHFAYDDKLERTNTGGVKNLLRFCAENGAKFIQVSTISVGGIYRKDGEPLTLTEKDLYIGQEIRNQYILSKYMAEYAALRAAIDQGIEVKIMRVGNLQGRISDGEFQVQKKTNAFTRQLLGYAQVGYVPQSLYDSSVNFSPVDEVARMIVALSRMPKKYSVFHVYPPQDTPFNRLFSTLSELGFRLEIVDDNSFADRLKALREDEEGRRIAESILVERPSLQYIDATVSEDFTQRLLSKLGCYWQPVTDGYLNKYLKALVEMQLTEED